MRKICMRIPDFDLGGAIWLNTETVCVHKYTLKPLLIYNQVIVKEAPYNTNDLGAEDPTSSPEFYCHLQHDIEQTLLHLL